MNHSNVGQNSMVLSCEVAAKVPRVLLSAAFIHVLIESELCPDKQIQGMFTFTSSLVCPKKVVVSW